MNAHKEHIEEFCHKFILTEQDILENLGQEKSWESRYRSIMLLGKQLPSITDDLKREEALVQGCESKVWLNAIWHENQLLIAAGSDAKIVKGLVTIVLAAYNNKTKAEINDFNIDDYFSSLKLKQNLSPSRTNGLFAMVKKIQAIASSSDAYNTL